MSEHCSFLWRMSEHCSFLWRNIAAFYGGCRNIAAFYGECRNIAAMEHQLLHRKCYNTKLYVENVFVQNVVGITPLCMMSECRFFLWKCRNIEVFLGKYPVYHQHNTNHIITKFIEMLEYMYIKKTQIKKNSNCLKI